MFFSKGKKNNECSLWYTVTSILSRGRLNFQGNSGGWKHRQNYKLNWKNNYALALSVLGRFIGRHKFFITMTLLNFRCGNWRRDAYRKMSHKQGWVNTIPCEAKPKQHQNAFVSGVPASALEGYLSTPPGVSSYLSVSLSSQNIQLICLSVCLSMSLAKSLYLSLKGKSWKGTTV